MQTIQVTTPQNVTIEYLPASVGHRIFSKILDGFIILAISTGVSIGFIALIKKFVPGNKADSVRFVFFVLLAAILLAYDLLCELFMNGQSLGKIITRIKVVKLDGRQPGLGSYFLRWVFLLIDVGFGAGAVAVLTILINGKGQRLGDIAAGTAVISLRKRASLDETMYVDPGKNYTPVFPEAQDVDERDIAVVSEVLVFARKNKRSKAAKEILAKTRTKIAQKTGITADMADKDFLETVLRDYNHLHGKI